MIQYEAPYTLKKYLGSDAFVRCVMGPVGSGKSSASVLEIVRRAAEQKPSPDGIRRTRCAVIRNTYGQLRDTTRKTFEQWIPPEAGNWSEQDFCFELRHGDVECDVLFRALDRPEDVRKLLSLELTFAYVNELREVPKHVFDVLQSRLGRYPSRIQGGPTWFGMWGDTNPWHTGHWGAKLFAKPLRGMRIFRQPGGRSAAAENVENLPDGYYERLCIGKDPEWIRVYVDGEEASSAVGSVYGDLLEALAQRKGILEFSHEMDGVFTSWDLGISDSTAIWFWRLNGAGSIDVIDHYEAHGKGISHFFDVVDARGYQYLKHWLPHDATARTLVTGTSIQDRFLEQYGDAGKFAIVPKLDVADGIDAARWLLEQPIRFHTRCEEGLEMLRSFRYEWSEENQVFSRKPVHDFASHSSDAFKYLATVAKHSVSIFKPKPPKGPEVISRPPPTFNRLFKQTIANRHRSRF